MLPSEAKRHLKEMGCIKENKLGDFWITGVPYRDPDPHQREGHERDVDLFVACIKCLGAYSVVTEYCGASVYVTTGDSPDQLRFRLVENKLRKESHA